MKKIFGLEIPQELEEVCRPHKTALIVYDMQIGILRQIKNGEEIIAQVLKVLTAARKAGIRVIFFRHLSMPKELMGTFQYRMAMAWQRKTEPEEIHPWFLRDSEGFDVTPELAPQANEAILDKITMSAFEGTPLQIILRDCEINSFVIVGVATEIGIEPTARHAADLGILPVIVTDACGAGHQDAAERSIESLKFAGDAMFTDTETICQIFEKFNK